MAETTPRTITAGFEVIGWDETPYEEPLEGPRLTRITVRKRFSGALTGTSLAEVLTVQGEAGSGYVASERVEGALDGRTGSFVLQHGGVDAPGETRTFGHVVPASGTGELAGLEGEATFAHAQAGGRLVLTFTL